MRLPASLKGTLARRIGWLSWSKWLPWPLWVLVVYANRPPHFLFGVSMVVGGLVCILMFAALQAWELSLRRQFVREAPLPRFLGAKLREKYPQLSVRDTELVLHGLRQFFMAYLRSKRSFVAMPSQVVDAAWHAFILHTKAYEVWCAAAFGTLLHHTPAEVLGRDSRRNDGLRRSWYWACKEESINPRKPSRLPLLFALDGKYAIPGGFTYVPDCSDIDRKSGSDAYCGTGFSDGGDSGASGDAGGFGGSDSGDGGGGGCGGGD